MKRLMIIIALTACTIVAEAQSNDNRALIGIWEFSGGTIEFASNGDGEMRFKNVNRNAPCPDGSVTAFKWEVVDGNKLYLDYKAMHICGEKQPTPENDAPKSYKVNGNQLSWAGVKWIRL